MCIRDRHTGSGGDARLKGQADECYDETAGTFHGNIGDIGDTKRCLLYTSRCV